MDLTRLKNYSLKVIFMFLFLFFLNASFSFSSCQTFDSVEFFTQSGGVEYQSSIESNINVVSDNVTSHPLSIVLLKKVNDNCHSENDYALDVANAFRGADAFQEIQNDDETYTYIWRFELSQEGFIFTQNYGQFTFVNTINTTESKTLSIRIDRQIPTLDINSISTNSGSLNINQVQESNNLKRGDILTIDIVGRDDIAVNNLEIETIQGGDVTNSSLNDESQNIKQLFSRVNLTSSPLDVSFKVEDKFGKEKKTNLSIPFDAYDPTIQTLEIKSYEITSNKNYAFTGELKILDDFEISAQDVEIRFLSPEANQVSTQIISCEIDTQQEGDLKQTICQFRSSPFQVTQSFNTTFDIIIQDKVENTASSLIDRNIQIDTSSVEIGTFELKNSINKTNIISPLSGENSLIILEFTNNLNQFYRAGLSENEVPSIEIEIDFGPFNDVNYECELIDSSTYSQMCVWNISSDLLNSFSEEEFNITVELTDMIGNKALREITIEVDDSVPTIRSFNIVERGNERNTVFESYELVRMEVIVEDIGERVLELSSNGSAILFKDSPEDVSFTCNVENLEDNSGVFQRCFSDEFQLNKGFDGNRSELLFVDVLTPAGNKASSFSDIKIFKVNGNESVDYFDFEFSSILTPLNRRIVSQQGTQVYHSFSIKPKNNDKEYTIVSVELLGMGDSIGEDIDVRLRNFLLQSQTSQGIVLGDNREFFLQSFMPRLLSAYEMETAQSSIMISIVKKDIDTIYKDENITIPLPIEFYDLPRSINSNIALAEKLLDDINGVNENVRNGESLVDRYRTYYKICSSYNTIKSGIQSVSQSWNIISLSFGHLISGSEVTDEMLTRPAKAESMLGNVDNIMGKVCMLASCSFSQEILGGALDSVTGDFEAGAYITGQKTFLGNTMCKIE